MFRKLSEIDRIFGTMDLFKNQMNRFLDELDSGRAHFNQGSGRPRTNFFDAGNILYVYREMSGVPEEDLSIRLHNNLLTIAGQRRLTLPEGYTVLRQERNDTAFSRSFTLPVEIDPEQTTAHLKNGILTVKLVKAQVAEPKKIVVRAA
ncbi:MAG: Hsp20/alpha crystallin family protein [Thermodesulfobacteriota bacterium]